MTETLLEARNIAVYKAPGQSIIANVNFDIRDRDIIVLQGKSGSGYVKLQFLTFVNS